MPRGPVLALATLLACLSGCTTADPAHAKNWLQRFQGPGGANGVVLEVALIEAPIGDRALNFDVWSSADEYFVTLETKRRLRDNGLRVAHVGPTPPAELLAMLTSPRQCPNPRQVQIETGKPSPLLPLGPPLETCRYELRLGTSLSERDLEQTQFGVIVEPSLAGKDRVKLKFTPRIHHARKGEIPWQPRADRSGWTLQVGPCEEDHTALAWEASLAPGEFVLIGSRFDSPDTFGHRALVREEENSPVQRMLVVRAARAQPDLLPPAETAFGTRAVPLAVQASLSSVRGVSP